MLYQSKTLLEFGYNSLFYTHIDNGLWDIATVTMQYWNPEILVWAKKENIREKVIRISRIDLSGNYVTTNTVLNLGPP